MLRRDFLATSLALGLPGAAFAQAWPAKPVRFIVPYIPGSAPDVLARTLAERLSGPLGQSLVIENRPGAGGNIGTEMVAKAPPDGYTIGLATSAIATNPWLYRKIGFDPLTDFTLLNLTTGMPHVLVVHSDTPIKTTAELVRMLKEAPGKHHYASGGNGSGAHFCGELFKSGAGVDMVHVPYKGAPDIINSVAGKTTLCGFPTLATAVPHIKAGRLRALGVTGTRRNHAIPDVPSIADTVPGFDYMSWFGLFGPARMPAEVVQRIDAEMGKLMQDSAFRDRLQADGSEARNLGSAEFSAFFKTDYPRAKRMVELSGARVD